MACKCDSVQQMRKDSTLIMEKTHLIGRLIEKELFIRATPQRVFQALTEKADLERWFVQKAEIDVRPGGGDQARVGAGRGRNWQDPRARTAPLP